MEVNTAKRQANTTKCERGEVNGDSFADFVTIWIVPGYYMDQ